jgi:hypothetical protein
MSSHFKRPLFVCSLTFACLLSIADDLTAQEGKPQRTPGALVMGSSLGPGAAFPVIPNEPYIAIVRMQNIETTKAGVRVMHEALNIRMRDSAGRIRDEQLASAPDASGSSVQGNVHIVDPNRMLDIQLHEDTKAVLTSSFSPAFRLRRESPVPDCSPRAASCQDQVTCQDLGSRDVDGLDAVGCRITRIVAKTPENIWSGTSVTEVWSSPELQINLLTTVQELDGTEQINTLSDLRRVEPDPALFQVPLGYTDPTKAPTPATENTNPTEAAPFENIGHLGWHESPATLINVGGRPLAMVASAFQHEAAPAPSPDECGCYRSVTNRSTFRESRAGSTVDATLA